MDARRRQRGVAGHQGGLQDFGECDISRIVGGQVVAELPYPGQEYVMGISSEGEVGQIFQRLRTTLRVYLARRRVAAQHLGDLEVEEVGGVECLAGRGQRSEEHTSELQSLAYLVCRLLLEKKKKKPPSVERPCPEPNPKCTLT